MKMKMNWVDETTGTDEFSSTTSGGGGRKDVEEFGEDVGRSPPRLLPDAQFTQLHLL